MFGLSWILAVSLLLADAAVPPAPTPLRHSYLTAPLYVIVPFGEPGDTDPVLRESTRKFSEDLSDRGVRSALGLPTDSVESRLR